MFFADYARPNNGEIMGWSRELAQIAILLAHVVLTAQFLEVSKSWKCVFAHGTMINGKRYVKHLEKAAWQFPFFR
jgi:hypothetical protein